MMDTLSIPEAFHDRERSQVHQQIIDTAREERLRRRKEGNADVPREQNKGDKVC